MFAAHLVWWQILKNVEALNKKIPEKFTQQYFGISRNYDLVVFFHDFIISFVFTKFLSTFFPSKAKLHQKPFNNLRNKMRNVVDRRIANFDVNALVNQVLDEPPKICLSLWSTCTAVGGYVSGTFPRHNERTVISDILLKCGVKIT